MTEAEIYELLGSNQVSNNNPEKSAVSESDIYKMMGKSAPSQEQESSGVTESDIYQMMDQPLKENPATAPFYEPFMRGLSKSSTGAPIRTVMGIPGYLPKKDKTFLEDVQESLGQIVGDIPAMFVGSSIGSLVGGAGGALVGGAIGSLVPGTGTAAGASAGAGIGGVGGAGAGMFALPAAISAVFAQYDDYVNKGGKKELGDFILDYGKIGKETLKAAGMGAAFSAAAPFLAKSLPQIAKIPGLGKLLKTKPGFYLGAKGSELVALTGSRGLVDSIEEGKVKIPTLREFAHDAFVLTGLGFGKKALKGIKGYTERAMEATPTPAEAEIGAKEVGLAEKEMTFKEKSVEPTMEIAQEARDLAKERTALESEKTRISEMKEQRAKLEHATKKAAYDTYGKLVESIIPKEIGGKKIADYVKNIPDSRADRAKLNKVLVDRLGEGAETIAENTFDIRQEQRQYEEKYGKISKEKGEDMMHVMQGKANPKIPGDMPEAVRARLTESEIELTKKAKKYYDNMLEANNKDPQLKKINPRESVIDKYLPGMYEESPAKIQEVYDRVLSNLKIKNPAANAKVFLTVADAMTKGGLTPKYTNPFDLMAKYGEQQLKVRMNNKIVNDVRNLESISGEKFIINPVDDIQARSYRAKGYIPMYDNLLRMIKQPDGSFRRSSKPAMVSPEFYKEFGGLFNREMYAKPDNIFWRAVDKVNTAVSALRVAMSPFHYFTQLENVAGQLGLGKAKGVFTGSIMQEGRELLNNKEFVKSAARAFMQHGGYSQENLRKGANLLEQGIEYFMGQKPPGVPDGPIAIEKMQRGMHYLHNQFIPNLKRVSYWELLNQQRAQFKKTHGRSLTKAEGLQLERIVGEQINNVFGGQNWATSKFFKNKNQRKVLRRLIAYPDWTISNIKQAMGAFKPGIAGQIGRKYIGRYILNNMMLAGVTRAMLGSIYQNDEGKLSFDPMRGLKSFWDIKLGEGAIPFLRSTFSWKYPVYDYRYGPGKNDVLRIGRNEDGSRMEGHMGKQLLELGGYLRGLDSMIATLYNKSTPVIQEAWKQLAGSTPSEYGSFTVNPKYVGGKRVPWQGKTGLAQVGERGKELLKTAVPFSARGGMQKWLLSVFGSFPISKEASLFKSEKGIRNALEDQNQKRSIAKLEAIREKLRDNEVPNDKINQRISQVRGQIFRDKYMDRVRKIVQIKDDAKRNRMIKALKEKMKADQLDVSAQSISSIFKTAINDLNRDGAFTREYAEYLQGSIRSKKGRKKRKARKKRIS